MPSESTVNNATDQETPEGIALLEKDGDKRKYECLICKTNIPSTKNLKDHIKGKKHITRLKKKQKKYKNIKPDETATLGKPVEEPSNTKEESNSNPQPNPDKEMYSERYPPYSRRSWNSGFPQNNGEQNHQYPPYHFRQTHGRNWNFPTESNWQSDPNYYSFENPKHYESGRANDRNNHPNDHRMYRDWPESSNSSYSYHEPQQGKDFDSKYQRSRDNQSYSERDTSYTSRRSKHESNERSSRENPTSGGKDSSHGSRKSKHESNNEHKTTRNNSSNVSSKSTSNDATNKKQSKKSETTVHSVKEQDTSDQYSHNESNKSETKNVSVNHEDLIKNSDKNYMEKQRKVSGLKTSSRGRNSSETTSSGQMSEIPKTQRRSSAENVTDRIAQLINPSNPKDKAEVLKLVTQFSKSKRKENLVKLNQQTDNDSWEKSPYSKKKLKSAPGPSDAPNQSENSDKRNESNHETVQEVSNINPFGVKSPRKREKRKTNIENSEPRVKRVRKRLSDPKIHVQERQLLREVAEEKLRNSHSSKHTCSSAECLESCILNNVERDNATGSSSSTPTSQKKKTSKSLQKSIKEVYNPESISLNNQTVSNELDSMAKSRTVNGASNPSRSMDSENIQQRPVKQEVEAPNVQFHPCLLEAFTLAEAINEQQTGNLNNSNGTIAVESLIDLFASGSVKVKKEFDDPLIDVIRTVDPEILNQACEAHMSNASHQSGSENTPPQVSSPSESALPTAEDGSINEGSEADDSSNYPLLKASFKNILNEMQNISNLEEKVKTDLQKAESKIQEFQALIDEWKTKKIKLQSEEEILRKQRNSLVRTMADIVTQSNFENSEELSKTADPRVPSISLVNADTNQNVSSNTPSRPSKSPTPLTQGKTAGCQSNSVVDESEEIAILPVPDKSSNIPVIDLEDSDSEGSQPAGGTEKSSGTDIFSENVSGTVNFPTHGSSVNSLQVFEDYLYTCSNDSTARRFPLGKNTGMVVYNHQKRNVSQICVEKVRGLTLVFTICTGSKTVTAFKAKDGTPFRTYNLSFSVASLCKSKGLIYAGLRNGSIVVCNWKDHKELVNISEPIRSIDTTHQGRLNILVTLSVHGNVSIRDAERNGLLIRYVKARSYLPLFMTVCSDSVYLSSAGVMTVLNIESGTFSSKYSFSAAYTCLAVFRDSIFTASFSGLVRCYPKDEERLVKMYYGAGNTAITCIHVHNGWVFTGNRFGAISVFKHDPDTVHPCMMGKCDFLFPRLEDLKTHVLQGKYHVFPQPGTQCTWRKCSFVFPLVWEPEYIKIHLSDHVCSQA